jgi:hypothetical protein
MLFVRLHPGPIKNASLKLQRPFVFSSIVRIRRRASDLVHDYAQWRGRNLFSPYTISIENGFHGDGKFSQLVEKQLALLRFLWLGRQKTRSFDKELAARFNLRDRQRVSYSGIQRQAIAKHYFTLLKQNFVSLAVRDFFFFSVYTLFARNFSFYSRLYRRKLPRGFALNIRMLLRFLRTNRVFLMTCGQNKVRMSSTFWMVPGLWRPIHIGRSRLPLFSYRHIIHSEQLCAALLLNQPHRLFFLTLLSNPYFWGLLRQGLFSKYRH